MASQRKKRGQPQVSHTLLNALPGNLYTKDENQKFMHAIEVGDTNKVKEIIHSNADIDMSQTDGLGRTPLYIAIENEHLEIAELFLNMLHPNILYSGLLLAISMDRTDIAIAMVKHPFYETYQKSKYLARPSMPFEGASPSNASVLFHPDTTPVILAAKRNNYELLAIFRDVEQPISEPDDQDCQCPKCDFYRNMDELRFAEARLNAYRGLASEAYICLYSEDPILTAFKLRQRLLDVVKAEKHYRDEYQILCRQLSELTVKLLDNVNGQDELEIILNEGDDTPLPSYSRGSLARIRMALECEEKGFIAHPICQKMLNSIWYGEYRTYGSTALNMLASFLVCLNIPLIVIIYYLTHNRKAQRFLSSPYVKFVGQTLGFFIFLLLLLFYSLLESPSNETLEEAAYAHDLTSDQVNDLRAKWRPVVLFDKMKVRRYRISPLEAAVLTFVIALIWQECKQVYSVGWKVYLFSFYNVLDSVSLSLYVAVFTVRVYTFQKTHESLVFLFTDALRINVANISMENPATADALYWIVADRFYWNAIDPLAVSEGIFAVANVITFSRLFYLLAVNEQLGPLQVSLGKMLWDIVRFMTMFAIVIFAFLVGLNNLYWYYSISIRQQVEIFDHGDTGAQDAFGTIEKSFTTVFWALFGHGDHTDVVLGEQYSDSFTKRVGYFVYGAYNLASIVLINMLIAMMTKSFDRTQENEDVEWKFARANLYMDFISDESFIPVPFNIIPSPHTIYAIFKWIYKRICNCCPASEKEEKSKEVNDGRLIDSDDYIKKSSIKSKTESLDVPGSSPPSFAGRRRSSITPSMASIQEGGKLDKVLDKLTGTSKSVTLCDRPKLDYKDVIKTIVRRYVFNRKDTEDIPLQGDIEELKQDMSSYRYDLLSSLKETKRELKDTVNALSAKLDIMASSTQLISPQPAAHNTFTLGKPSREEERIEVGDVEPLIIPEHVAWMDEQPRRAPVTANPIWKRLQAIVERRDSSEIEVKHKMSRLKRTSLAARTALIGSHQSKPNGGDNSESPVVPLLNTDPNSGDSTNNNSTSGLKSSIFSVVQQLNDKSRGSSSENLSYSTMALQPTEMDNSNSSERIQKETSESAAIPGEDFWPEAINNKRSSCKPPTTARSYNYNDLERLISLLEEEPLDADNKKRYKEIMKYSKKKEKMFTPKQRGSKKDKTVVSTSERSKLERPSTLQKKLVNNDGNGNELDQVISHVVAENMKDPTSTLTDNSELLSSNNNKEGSIDSLDFTEEHIVNSDDKSEDSLGSSEAESRIVRLDAPLAHRPSAPIVFEDISLANLPSKSSTDESNDATPKPERAFSTDSSGSCDLPSITVSDFTSPENPTCHGVQIDTPDKKITNSPKSPKKYVSFHNPFAKKKLARKQKATFRGLVEDMRTNETAASLMIDQGRINRLSEEQSYDDYSQTNVAFVSDSQVISDNNISDSEV